MEPSILFVVSPLNTARLSCGKALASAPRSSRSPPSRYRVVPSPTISCRNDSSHNQSKQPPVHPNDLLSEQMAAYFASSDTTFQPRLAPTVQLALRNFVVELSELILTLRRFVGLEPPARYTPPYVLGLQLNNDAVNQRENSRVPAQASRPVLLVYNVTCRFLDFFFNGRPIQRFWVLETVARMPYFAYSSCLHLYATLGWYRSPTLMNMHHAEELNEAYHLAVMESLGGDKSWIDRFMAFHASLIYYWSLVILFLISPSESYRFSELIEMHAVDTYSEFLDSNEEVLRSLPPPTVSHEYYNDFLFYFQEFQQIDSNDSGVGESKARPRPVIESLYDVFDNILRDEEEHSRSMLACSKFIAEGQPMYYNGKEIQARSRGDGEIPTNTRMAYWKKWTKLVSQASRTKDSSNS